MQDEERIGAFLAAVKAEWRSSPDGIHWHRFFEFLERHARGPEDGPPRPFILSGSSSSCASKHRQLEAQLLWASQRGCLDEALALLEGLPPNHWNSSLPHRWHKHSFED